MQAVILFILRGWRALIVILIIGVPISVIGAATAYTPLISEPSVFAIRGTRFGDISFTSQTQQFTNASVQALLLDTPNDALDEAVNNTVKTQIQAFIAALPSTPAVKGFFHQLRVIPKVDYSAGKIISVTLETDEYHPTGQVSVRYESWLSAGDKIEQPRLDSAIAASLVKNLPIDSRTLKSHFGEHLAVGLLPDYKIRLYSSGLLASLISTPYLDLSLNQLPELAETYRKTYFPGYPEHISKTAQDGLDRGLARALKRHVSPTDCIRDSCIALTFDDGPDEAVTPRMLRSLKTSGVKATFFMLGNHVQRYPELVRRVASEGHEIENHTFAHADLVKLHDREPIRKQIDDAHAILAELGIQAKFLRPPYGFADDNVRMIADMPFILWNVDAQEWRPETSPSTMAASIVAQARPGAIILMHDTKSISADALPVVISRLQVRGFRFVSVAELLQIDSSARGEFSSR